MTTVQQLRGGRVIVQKGWTIWWAEGSLAGGLREAKAPNLGEGWREPLGNCIDSGGPQVSGLRPRGGPEWQGGIRGRILEGHISRCCGCSGRVSGGTQGCLDEQPEVWAETRRGGGEAPKGGVGLGDKVTVRRVKGDEESHVTVTGNMPPSPRLVVGGLAETRSLLIIPAWEGVERE